MRADYVISGYSLTPILKRASVRSTPYSTYVPPYFRTVHTGTYSTYVPYWYLLSGVDP